jgi:hypothetical protein
MEQGGRPMATHDDVVNIAFRAFSALFIAVPVFKSCILYTCNSAPGERRKRNHASAEKHL